MNLSKHLLEPGLDLARRSGLSFASRSASVLVVIV